jgi:hypothetical protein
MASYVEIRNLFSHDDLKNRVEVATVVAANGLLAGTAAEQKFAAHVFSNPRLVSDKVLMSVLAANRTATVAQITGASDSALQTAVQVAIPALVVAYGG